ncbi:Gem-associated protein 5 [Mortierella hygrophila]|uniref:Gem-associated protein 5 n=1 Tax=Mortierella hygrophila TaxID=979708 RepID=A0A9P6F3W5_9FUNG|nr:Gem-associated protein 5 [Mortierella hygrophila]
MDTVFPPSPQWHQPHSACLVSQGENAGWLVYSHNNTIQILNPFSLKHQGVLRDSHTARINALAARPLRRTSASTAATDGDGVEEGLASSSSSLYSSPASSGPLSGAESAISSDLDHLRCPLDNSANSCVATTDRNDEPMVASVGEDMRVVCWNLSSRRATASHFKVHNKVIKAVEWTGEGQLIVSGDKGGVIVVWDPFQEKKTLKFELPTKPSISCMSSSPTHPDVIAIGMDGGDIFVCKTDLSGVFVQQRLHGHTERIHSLAWQPSQFQGQDYTSLASGSGDQTVRVWDVVSEISSVVMKVPDLDDKLLHSQKVKFWVPVGWVSQGKRLLSATSRGKMVVWDMNRKNSSGYSKMIGGKLHDRQVYQIMVWPSGSFAFTTSMDRRIIAWDVDNGQGLAQIECIGGNVYALDIGTVDPGRIAICLGNETLKIWNTLSREEPYECITIDRLNTRARAVRWHPAEEGTLCFGLESGKIGMLTQVHESFSADSKNVNNGNGAGSRKGRKKGRHDKQAAHASSGPTQTIFHSYHEKSVTSMAWCSSKVFEAPVPELFDLALRDGTFCLVSCGGEGKILVSDASKPSSKSLDLDVVIQRQNAAWYEAYRAIKGTGQPERRDFAIHPNEDLLALGNADGSVEVFELKYFKLVYVYQSHRSRVNRVCWSETGSRGGGQAGAGGEDGSGVMDLYLLASGSDEGVVAIHNLQHFSGSALAEKRASRKEASSSSTEDPLDDSSVTLSTAAGTDTDIVLPTSQVLSSFQYHSKGISDLAWSPHGPTDSVESATRYHRIVTASYDGKAVVVEVRIEDSSAEPIQDIPQDGAGENAEEGSDSDVSTPVLSARQHRAVASYTDHEDQVLSVSWSLTETDRVYSGGNDWGLCSWDVKSHSLTEAQSLALVRGGGFRKHPKTIDGGKGSTKSQLATTASASPVISVEETSSQPQLPRPTSAAQAEGEDVSMQGENLQADQTLLAPEDRHIIAIEPFASKRTSGSSPHPESTPTKRSRITSNNPVANTITTTAAAPRISEPSASTTTTSTSTHIQKLSTPTKRLQLFPMGTAAFHGQSTRKIHLEILRLTRNLYCRRIHQGGVLRTEEELEAARGRWRAMRAFFEEDGEDEGKALSSTLVQDVDEMNLEDEDTSLSGQHIASGTGQLTAADDASASSGDLIFYGSRESVKALAELEAEEMAQTQPQNIFVIGSGMGVMPPASSSLKDSIVQTKNGTRPRAAGQLCQVPVSCWLGDVPKVLDIVSALGPSEVGVQDWIAIALSPMGGVEAWKGMMVKTAGKFEARGEVHAAGLCYLSVGMIFEAVDVYRKQGLFREALTLLRIRHWDHHDDDDMEEDGRDGTDMEVQNEDHDETSPPATTTSLPVNANKKDLRQLHLRILTEWGQQLEKRNQYEQACKCQLTLGSLLKTRSASTKKVTAVDSETKVPSVGLQTLARRGDVATLRTVAGLAILMDDPTVQESVARYRSALQLKKEALHNRRSQV